MTPTEKAKELYRFYIDYTQGHYNCKQCCLIAVDEIIKTFIDIDPKLIYWQEVKQEIEKL